MRVGVVAEQIRHRVPGGIGTYVTGLLQGLASLAAPELEVVALASRCRDHDPLQDLGIEVLNSRHSHRVQMALWDRGLGLPETPLDLLHLTSFAGPLRKERSLSRTVMAHDLSWRLYPELTTARGARWHEAALQRVIRAEAMVLTASSEVAQQLHEAGVATEHIAVVHHGSDHLKGSDDDAARALLEALGIAEPFLLTVSTLEPRKNLPGLIAAYEQLRGRLAEPCPLLVVGPAGWGPKLKASDGVVLAGRQPDETLVSLYRLARCFVYVPLHEGFGLPPLEAMSEAAPVVVSTAVPSTQESDACWKVKADDAEAIASALFEALSDPVARSEHGANGQRFAQRFRWVDAAREHFEVWKALS
jgi:glycosyltransferase involved in cell wall biosynthesis